MSGYPPRRYPPRRYPPRRIQPYPDPGPDLVAPPQVFRDDCLPPTISDFVTRLPPLPTPLPTVPPASTGPALDSTAFPHILDNIVRHADYDGLLALRGASRSLRDQVDSRILPHATLISLYECDAREIQCECGLERPVAALAEPTTLRLLPVLPLDGHEPPPTDGTSPNLGKYLFSLDCAFPFWIGLSPSAVLHLPRIPIYRKYSNQTALPAHIVVESLDMTLVDHHDTASIAGAWPLAVYSLPTAQNGAADAHIIHLHYSYDPYVWPNYISLRPPLALEDRPREIVLVLPQLESFLLTSTLPEHQWRMAIFYGGMTVAVSKTIGEVLYIPYNAVRPILPPALTIVGLESVCRGLDLPLPTTPLFSEYVSRLLEFLMVPPQLHCRLKFVTREEWLSGRTSMYTARGVTHVDNAELDIPVMEHIEIV